MIEEAIGSSEECENKGGYKSVAEEEENKQGPVSVLKRISGHAHCCGRRFLGRRVWMRGFHDWLRQRPYTLFILFGYSSYLNGLPDHPVHLYGPHG
jgi:hypothetical protein